MKAAHQQISPKQYAAIWIPIILIAALTAVLSNFAPPRENLTIFLSLFAASATFLTAVIWRNFAFFQSPKISRHRWLIFIIASAALLRIGALAAPVSLSDDVYRYAWDGQVFLSGYNPYAFTPARFNEIFDGIAPHIENFDKLNSPYYGTVYPPLAQITFATGALLAELTPLSIERSIRLLFLLADLLTILLLAKSLEKLGKNRVIALFYAWNPFIFWEFVAGGHSEALLLPGLLLFIHAVISNKTATKIGLFLGLAALLKPTVLVISPVIAVYLLRKRNFFAAAITAVVSAATVATGYALFWDYELLPSHLDSFALYAKTFSFNAPIFYILQYLAGYQEGVTPPVQHLLTPWLNLITIAIIAIAAITQNGRSTNRLILGFTAALAAHLFLSPVFHPWYLTPVLLCALLTNKKFYAPILIFSLLVPLSYLFYIPNLSQNEKILIMALQFIPLSLLFMLSPAKTTFNKAIHSILKSRAHTKFNAISPHLSPGDRILDIGAGEGFVGLHAFEKGHETHLVDVSNRNRTTLAFSTYDGHTLPFEDSQFDVGILAYVLHHCHDPDQVLKEAARVCRKLIILETVYVTEHDRRRTTFLDHNANRLRGMRKEPLNFDTAEGWTHRFNQLNLQTSHVEWLGRGIHKHLIFVLDRN